MNRSKVAIIGLGTVGSGLANILLNQSQLISSRCGGELELAHVVVRDINKPLRCELPQGVATDQLERVLRDPEVSVVAQLIGGTEPARSIMLQVLESGKNVVTANKALMAEHGPELVARARELGRTIAFEAAVAGGIPIIANLSQCLAANQILSLQGILNGTSNFIVSQMESGGCSYEDALAEAQEMGYAEADPSMDVDGTDAAQKLAILAHLAFGVSVDWRDIPRQGIQSLQTLDMICAGELGFRIRLLAVAKLSDGQLELHVSPTLVPMGTPMADVQDAFNAIRVEGHAVGPVFYHGQGAGQMPTASAVAADVMDMAVGRAQATFQARPLWNGEAPAGLEIMPPADVRGRFYLRFDVQDRSGVLADIASALGQQDVSIASMVQPEAESEDGQEQADVSVVIMTHTASYGAVTKAVQAINKLDSVTGDGVAMRVL